MIVDICMKYLISMEFFFYESSEQLIKIAEYLIFFFWIFKSSNSKPNVYSKTCLKQPLKKDKTKILMTNDSFNNESRKYCNMEHSAILLTCIK